MTETPLTDEQSARRDGYIAAFAGITVEELRTAHPSVRESFRATFGEKADAAAAVSDAEIQRNTDSLRASWTAEVDQVTSQRDRLRTENECLQRVADREHRNFVQTHDGLNRLSEEARQMAEANGAEEQWAQVRRAVAAAEEEKRRRQDDGRKLVDSRRTVERLRVELAARPTRSAVLREAADVIDLDTSVSAAVHASSKLRRLADEIQQDDAGAAHREGFRTTGTPLSAACANCRHALNWHTTGSARTACQVGRCGCQEFTAERDDAGKDTRKGESTRATSPALGDRYHCRHGGEGITVTRLWALDNGHPAVDFEYRDGESSALPLDSFHRVYQPAEGGDAR